jgi:hypothetical protein
MILLPTGINPNSIKLAMLDYGLTLRPALGGAVQRVSRAGSRYRAEMTFPPLKTANAQQMISRLLEAKRTGGIRINFPLMDMPQGTPGMPVVNGAGQSGTSLVIRGLTAAYTFKEGFWLSIVAASGQPYLHNCRAALSADGLGNATILIEPPLRVPFLDGATILIAAPVIEGFIDGGEWSWDIDVQRTYGMSLTIEEAG